MNYRLLSSVLVAASFMSAGTAWAAEGTDPASKYLYMDLLEPDPENIPLCQPLPLYENFSDGSHYTQGNVLPDYWLTTGTSPWRTANNNVISAYSGIWYMISPESIYERDERAYTPFYYMEKGKTYTLNFATYQTQEVWDDGARNNTIILKVGTHQDSEFQPVTIDRIANVNTQNNWSEHSYTFSPLQSGAYCFCFELEGPSFSGVAIVDQVTLVSPEYPLAPEPHLAPFGVFEVGTDNLYSLGNDPSYFVDCTANGWATGWSMADREITMLPDGMAMATFDQSGEYEITVTGTNSLVEATSTETVKIKHSSEPIDNFIFHPSPASNVVYYGVSEAPAFSTNAWDYMVGPNHYYSEVAQYYHLPWNAEVTLKRWNYTVSSLGYAPKQHAADYQPSKPLRIKILGTDGAGYPDESKVYANFRFTMSQIFGNMLGGSMGGGDSHSLELPRPVTVTGPFFLVIEYSEELELENANATSSRTFAAVAVEKNMHGKTTIFCKPYKDPPGRVIDLEQWHPVNVMEPKWAGMAMAASFFASYKPGQSGIETADIEGEPVCYRDGASIVVKNVAADTPVRVYSVAGTQVASAKGQATIDASGLPSGIYIVTVGNHTYRIAK